jgi:nitroreductase
VNEAKPMKKNAPADHDVHPLIRERWSPRAFASRTVERAELRSLLEAARWAPSSFNEQPWRFLVAQREDEEGFQALLSCLNDTNQRWAKNAAVLVLSAASPSFARNGKPNRHALHDLGLAVSQLTLQATALGLRVHQMGGFSVERARELLSIPPTVEPVTVLAIGFPGNPDELPADLREKELRKRERKPLAELAFQGRWGAPLS